MAPCLRGWRDTREELALGSQRAVGGCEVCWAEGPGDAGIAAGAAGDPGAWMSHGGCPVVIWAWEAWGHRLCEFGGRWIRKR